MLRSGQDRIGCASGSHRCGIGVKAPESGRQLAGSSGIHGVSWIGPVERNHQDRTCAVDANRHAPSLWSRPRIAIMLAGG